MKIFFFTFLFPTITVSHVAAQSYVPEKKNKMLVPNAVPVNFFSVPVRHVKLLAGPFKTAMEAGWGLFRKSTGCEHNYRMAISVTWVRFKRSLAAMVQGS